MTRRWAIGARCLFLWGPSDALAGGGLVLDGDGETGSALYQLRLWMQRR